MMSISTEAAEARASLSDERELLRTFEVNAYNYYAVELDDEDSNRKQESFGEFNIAQMMRLLCSIARKNGNTVG